MTPTTMEKRALALAEEMSLFAKPRMWSLQIPGLARMLCTFAENELRLAGVEAHPVADCAVDPVGETQHSQDTRDE